MNKLTGLLFLALVFSGLLISQARAVEVGEAMPDFTLQTFDGRNFSLADFKDRPALLVFWNTWCPNCMQELPVLEQIAERYASRGLVILAINTGVNDSEEKARSYWEKSNYRFPSGMDQDMELLAKFGVRGVPTVLLADAKGFVHYKESFLPEDMEVVFSQLGGKGAATGRTLADPSTL